MLRTVRSDAQVVSCSFCILIAPCHNEDDNVVGLCELLNGTLMGLPEQDRRLIFIDRDSTD
jgi:hypothetical protein